MLARRGSSGASIQQDSIYPHLRWRRPRVHPPLQHGPGLPSGFPTRPPECDETATDSLVRDIRGHLATMDNPNLLVLVDKAAAEHVGAMADGV